MTINSINSIMPVATETIMQFPCEVPVTVIGRQVDGLVQAISECVHSIITDFDAHTIEMRPSKAGTYLAVAFTVTANSMLQLEHLNTVLKDHPLVKYVL